MSTVPYSSTSSTQPYRCTTLTVPYRCTSSTVLYRCKGLWENSLNSLWRQEQPASPPDATHIESQEKWQLTAWSPWPQQSTHTHKHAHPHTHTILKLRNTVSSHSCNHLWVLTPVLPMMRNSRTWKRPKPIFSTASSTVNVSSAVQTQPRIQHEETQHTLTLNETTFSGCEKVISVIYSDKPTLGSLLVQTYCSSSSSLGFCPAAPPPVGGWCWPAESSCDPPSWKRRWTTILFIVLLHHSESVWPVYTAKLQTNRII